MMTGITRLHVVFGVSVFFTSVSFHQSGSSQVCYTCSESTTMEECNSKMVQYNCTRVGSFHNMCALNCDWKNGLYIRECSMDHKCNTKQRECNRKGKKGPECEYHCCQGNLCNNGPCSIGHNIRSQIKGIVGLALLYLIVKVFFK